MPWNPRIASRGSVQFAAMMARDECALGGVEMELMRVLARW